MSIIGSAKQAVRRAFAPRDKATLRKVAATDGVNCAALVDAIEAVYGLKSNPPAAIRAIEAARTAMAADTRPLADGTQGTPGPFDDGITVADACGVSKPPSQAVLLYALARRLNPASILELGTNVGISSAFLGAGLADAGGSGRVLSLDVSPYRIEVARALHRDLAIGGIETRVGLFEDTLSGAIADAAPIDMAFIDGNHQYEPTLAYTDAIAERSIEGAIFVYDDVRWSDGMKQAWAEILKDRRFPVVIDLHSMGLALYAPSSKIEPVRTPVLYSVLART